MHAITEMRSPLAIKVWFLAGIPRILHRRQKQGGNGPPTFYCYVAGQRGLVRKRVNLLALGTVRTGRDLAAWEVEAADRPSLNSTHFATKLHQKWSQKAWNPKFSWGGMPPEPPSSALRALWPPHFKTASTSYVLYPYLFNLFLASEPQI